MSDVSMFGNFKFLENNYFHQFPEIAFGIE